MTVCSEGYIMYRCRALARIIVSSLVLCIVLPEPTAGQVVNIEGKRIRTDSTGWTGYLESMLQLERNIQTVVNAGFSTHLQHKSKYNKELWLLLGDYSLVRSESTPLINRWFFHLRYNRKLNDWLRWEAFSQFQNNKLISVQNRVLLGSGPRFKFWDTERWRMYAGTLYMYEYELGTDSRQEWNHRISTYLTFSLFSAEHWEVRSTTYFQPRVDLWSDHRLMQEARMQFRFGRRATWVVSLELVYDSAPPQGVPGLLYSLKNGLNYRFL